MEMKIGEKTFVENLIKDTSLANFWNVSPVLRVAQKSLKYFFGWGKTGHSSQ
jgi:hypothetical protein